MSALFRKAPLVLAIAVASSTSIVQAQILEEVIVTAQKRTESLQDVPISVSAIQGEKIQEAGITDMAALADYVPNLHISSGAVNTNIYMRGMGSGNNQAFEQSVGMYIDGIYMGRGRQYRSPFVDIERVEVLRGPQGTLFGKNTVAGAVNVTTASPSVGDETYGSISVAAESFDGLITEGFVSGDVSDTLALRFAFKYRESDGYVENTYLGVDEPEVEDTLYRLTAVWQPTDDLDINLKYSHSEYDRVGAPSTTKVYLDPAARDELVPNRSAFAIAAYGITDAFFPNFSAETQKEFTTYKDNNLGVDGTTLGIGKNPDGSENENDNVALKVDWAVGDFTITSVTGWSSYTSVDGVDVDWLPIQFISRDDDQEFEQYSQEFRITSPGGEFFDYIAGVYYEQSDLEFDRRVTIDVAMDGLVQTALGVPSLLYGAFSLNPDGSPSGIPADIYLPAQIARNHYYQLDSDSWAAFFEGTFNISDDFRVTVGLRYTEENKDVVSQQSLSDTITGINTPSLNPFLVATQAASFNTYTYAYDESRSTDKWLPSLKVQWNVGEDSLLYASLSQGFKSGGFTSADDGEPAGLIPGEVAAYDPTMPSDEFEFEDEEVDALEIGGKHTLLEGGMTLNWAAFYTKYDNLQTSVFKGVGFGVTNAAAATIKGIEIDMMWQATDELRIGANMAYLDATYDDFKDAPCTAIQLDVDQLCGTANGTTNNDLSGEVTTYAPEYSASVFFDYVLPLGDGLDVFTGGEVNFKDSYSPAGDNDPIDYIDSYTKTNLRVGLRTEEWEVMAYGSNIFDKEVFAQSADTPVLAGSHFTYADPGAVFGLRGKYNF